MPKTLGLKVSLSQSSIFPILLVNFIGSLGYGIILPFLAFLILDFGGNEMIYGVVAASYPLFQMIGAPILGKWSDRVGRKKVLFISQAGTLLSWLIFLLAFYMPMTDWIVIENGGENVLKLSAPLLIVFLARSLDGLTGGNISVANAYLSDITEEKERKKSFGKMSASMSLGFIIGPALASFIGLLGYGTVPIILVAATISLFGLFVIKYFLPDVPLEDDVYQCGAAPIKKVFGTEFKECYDTDKADKKGWSQVLGQKGAKFMVWLYFLIFLAFNLFYATFSMHTSTNLNWSVQQLGTFFTIMSGVMIISQRPLLTYLSNKFSDEQLFGIGSFILVFAFWSFTNPGMVIIFIGGIFFGIGNGLMWPSFLSILSKTGSSKMQGSLQGIANSAGSLAAIIGLLVGGYLLGVLSVNIYFISVGLLLILAVIGWVLSRGTDKV